MPSIRRTTKLTERTVTVLRRYIIKQAYNDLRVGDIVLVVRNDQGVEYTVTLHKGTKRHECTCPSYKPCYHIKNMVTAENARWEAEQAKKAEQYTMSDAVHAKLAALSVEASLEAKEDWKVTLLADKKRKEAMADERFSKKASEDLGARGNLNVSKGFSLMR